MTREEIISGLEFIVKMFLFNPSTGEICTDKTIYDACRGAIELLKQEPRKAIWIERSDIPRGCGEYQCSNCMDEYGTDLLYAYCPDCGVYHGKNKEIIKEEDFSKCDMKMINRGKCILCGKKLAEGLLFFCKECNK